MSKAQEPSAWDARDAFHRATMAVYADLGALVAVLKRESDLQVALLELDEHTTPGSAPDGDPKFAADIKHAAGRLRSSLATVQRIRKMLGSAACSFGRGGSFGGISTVSHHEALLGAAAEVLKPDAVRAARSGRTARQKSASGITRRNAIKSAVDTRSWARLAENLEHEYRSALLLAQPSPDEPKSPVASLVQPHPSDAAASRVGSETLQHLRAVLNVGVQVRYAQAKRGLQELRQQLRAEDLDALDRADAAKEAMTNAEIAVKANRGDLMPVHGPVFAALRNAGLLSINGTEVLFHGEDAERKQIINAERAKLETALQAARLARDAAPRPEQAIRNAHKAMLPLLRERLAKLRDLLQAHGPVFARPLGQDDPRYGPMVASHPPRFWSGPSAHDVLAQLVVDVLDTMDGNEAVGIVLADEEWERLRGHLVREAGELARRAPPAGITAEASRAEPEHHKRVQKGRSGTTSESEVNGLDLQDQAGTTVNPFDLIRQKVAAAMLGKKPPEFSDWVRKARQNGWVHPAWKEGKERFHYLLEPFAGATFLRSRIVELQVWLQGLDGKSKRKGSK